VTQLAARPTLLVPHVLRGVTNDEPEVHYAGFSTPKLDLDTVALPRSEPLPAANVPVSEIIELLVATGERLRDDPDGLVAQACEALVTSSPYHPDLIRRCFEDLHLMFKDRFSARIDAELGGVDLLDGWRSVEVDGASAGAIRAVPIRMVHVLAGNAPGVAAQTVIRGALTKGINVLKIPSNDLFSATTILRTMAAIAPDHPTVRSFSAAYWRGGDEAVESVLFRAQFFDKLVAWGGESAIRNAAKYLGPGFELVSFDPKSSISLIGEAGTRSGELLAEAARLGAMDSAHLNQEACTTSRFHFFEGTRSQADEYCELLLAELQVERRYTTARTTPPPMEVREEIELLEHLGSSYRVFGRPDGSGVVVRSDEPVDFYPSNKTVNVVVVPSLEVGIRAVTVATQTVGVYPSELKAVLRDRLAEAGAQRIVDLGGVAAGASPAGFPHDGFFPLQRFVRWVADENGRTA
jgi:hypothetical protein